MKFSHFFGLLLICMLTSSCLIKFKTIKEGSVGVKQRFGKYKTNSLEPGFKVYTMGTRMIRVEIRNRSFFIKQTARMADGTKITPNITVSLSINPNMVVDFLKEYGQKNIRNYTIYSFKSWFTPLIRQSIAEVVSTVTSFEEINANRTAFADIVEEKARKLLKNYVLIDELVVTTIHMTEVLAAEMDRRGALSQKLINTNLEIELEKREQELDSIRATSIKNSNKIIQPSLTPEILEKMNIENQQQNQNGNVIIVK